MLEQGQGGMRNWFRSGEPWVWMNAAAVGLSILAVVGILALIAINGFAHFWPRAVAQFEVTAGDHAGVLLGEIIDSDQLDRQRYIEATGDESVPEDLAIISRLLVKTGNRRIDPPDFRWIFEQHIASTTWPVDVIAVERTEWGNAYGFIEAVTTTGKTFSGEAAFAALIAEIEAAESLRDEITGLQRGSLQSINATLERLRLDDRRIELDESLDADTRSAALAATDQRRQQLQADYAAEENRLRELMAEFDGRSLTLRLADGRTEELPLATIVRAWQPNALSTAGKLGHYLRSVWLFLADDPREANTEGGIFPALFGTVLMVLLMSALVTPFGVIAALYLREYAKQGPFVRLIRIAVNNLAGVPSIVYGVFGLGFFVYFLGGSIDQVFFAEALPSPTFGTPGLLWASLTLALLTVPVVIVSTEEGLTRIPRSVREGSLARGATKAETLWPSRGLREKSRH
jgi:phosphate transport system permease protein